MYSWGIASNLRSILTDGPTRSEHGITPITAEGAADWAPQVHSFDAGLERWQERTQTIPQNDFDLLLMSARTHFALALFAKNLSVVMATNSLSPVFCPNYVGDVTLYFYTVLLPPTCMSWTTLYTLSAATHRGISVSMRCKCLGNHSCNQSSISPSK